MKKLLIIISLAGLVLPGLAGAALIDERGTSILNACVLKHDLTYLLGPEYFKGASITSDSSGQVPPTMIVATKTNLDGFVMAPGEVDLGFFKLAACTTGTGCLKILEKIPLYDFSPQTMTELDSVGLSVNGYRDTKDELQLAAAVSSDYKKLQDLVENNYKTIGGVVYAKDASLACTVDLIETIGDWFFIGLLVLAGVLILWGAYSFMTAAGSPDALKKGRDILIWACVGIAVAFLSKALVKLVEQIIM